MNKKVVSIISIILAACILGGLIYLFIYLGDNAEQEKSPAYQNQIVVDAQNSQKYILQNSEINQENLAVIYCYEGKEERIYDFTLDTSNFDSSILGLQTINISYNGFSTSYDVQVIDIAGLEEMILQGYSDTTSLYQSVNLDGAINALESYISNEQIYIKGYETYDDVYFYSDGIRYHYTPDTFTGTQTSSTMEEAMSEILSIPLDSNKTPFENFVYNFIHGAFTEIATVDDVSLDFYQGSYNLYLVLNDNSTTVYYSFDENFRITAEIIEQSDGVIERNSRSS